MSKQKSKTGLIFATTYLLLVLAALMFLFLMLRKTAFAGVYILVLTFPWSFVIFWILDLLGVIDSVFLVIKVLIFIICAILNASILYYMGSK